MRKRPSPLHNLLKDRDFNRNMDAATALAFCNLFSLDTWSWDGLARLLVAYYADTNDIEDFVYLLEKYLKED